MAEYNHDPFDLSAPKPAPETKPQEQKPEVPQATVHRVSMGPLLRSPIVKLFVFFSLLFFLAFGSYTAVTWWLLHR